MEIMLRVGYSSRTEGKCNVAWRQYKE